MTEASQIPLDQSTAFMDKEEDEEDHSGVSISHSTATSPSIQGKDPQPPSSTSASTSKDLQTDKNETTKQLEEELELEQGEEHKDKEDSVGAENDDNSNDNGPLNLSLDDQPTPLPQKFETPTKNAYNSFSQQQLPRNDNEDETQSQFSTPTHNLLPTTPSSIASSSPSLLNSFHGFPGHMEEEEDGGVGTAQPLSPHEHHALQQEMEGIQLLRQIFPDEPAHALRDLYYEHVLQKATAAVAAAEEAAILAAATPRPTPPLATHRISPSAESSTSLSLQQQQQHQSQQQQQRPKSQLGKRLWKQAQKKRQEQRQNALKWPEVTLPDDFLRLPPSVAVRRYQGEASPSLTNNSPLGSSWRYQLVHELEQRALQQEGVSLHGLLQSSSPTSSASGSIANGSTAITPLYFTAVISRHAQLGLGMTLHQEGKLIRVHSLAMFSGIPDDSQQQQPQEALPLHEHQQYHYVGPSYKAGILPGDILIGINGSAFRQSKSPKDPRLKHAVTSIHQSPDPVVLHLQRQPSIMTATNGTTTTTGMGQTVPPSLTLPRQASLVNGNSTTTYIKSPPARRPPNTSLLDEEEEEEDAAATFRDISSSPRHSSPISPNSKIKNTQSRSPMSPPPLTKPPPPPEVHPFATALAARGLLHSKQDEVVITRTLAHFTDRTRQWESTSSFRIHAKTFALKPHWDPKDLPPDMAAVLLPFDSYPHVKPELTFAPSTPTLEPTSPLIPQEYIDAFYGMNQGENDENDVGADEGDDGTPLTLFGRRLRRQQPPPALRKLRLFPYPGAKTKTPTKQRALSPPPSSDSAIPDIFIPLMGVRKALCARILNTFAEETRMAYTIWVYDVETGKEWYAPIRYLQDFSDLREATLPLCPEAIGSLPFPKTTKNGWTNVFGGAYSTRDESNEPERVRQGKRRQLEHFLRALLALAHCHKIHPRMAEIAIHVQSFLGCEAGLSDNHSGVGSGHSSDDEEKETTSLKKKNRRRRYNGESDIPGHDEYQMNVRRLLKRSIQRYTYRLFLLRTLNAIVDQFVDTTRASGPQMRELEMLEASGRAALKTRAMTDMERIQAFLDQLLDLILEGCMDDYESIAGRKEFHAIRSFFQPVPASDGNNSDGGALLRNNAQQAYWDRLVREAVREQIEIEVYVPLRSVVSRILVNGWRHEDMEVHFKMQELRKRPQGLFRIPDDKVSPSNWDSVATILKKGVEMNTLPCSKLRAIVEAAREISRLYNEEQQARRRRQLQLQRQNYNRPATVTWTASRRGNSSESLATPDDEKEKISPSTSEDDLDEEAGIEEHLGADDFLPIFIFAVVRAQMERPCALCVLLRTLCDKINRNGEIGYFLASFEAAITHIQEIDLTEDREEMLSFLSAPFTDVSLSDSMT